MKTRLCSLAAATLFFSLQATAQNSPPNGPAANPSDAPSRTVERSPGIRSVPPVMSTADIESIAARATVMQELPASLTLHVGQMALVRLPGVARVATGNGKVLEARVLDGTNLLVTAQDAGDSTLHVWDRQGVIRRVKVRVNVIDLERIANELREITFGISGVNIRRIGERIVVDGSNLDPAAVERLDTIAKLYAPAVVSLATADRIRVDRMVDIQVRIVEFSKTALDDLGVRWDASSQGFDFGLSLGSTINLLVQRGNAFLMASPTLSTRSGGEAKFLSGGEIPLPSLSTSGAGSVEFKPYGVRLNIKPIADGAGNISGSILTEVSSVDRSVAVQGIPGFLIRRTDTEFNVRNGETIVLSGLISRESSRANQGVPGLRNAPVIGRAFRADTDTDKDQEVIVFLTPRVVEAADSRPRIARARQLEQNVSRGFGNLTEDRTDRGRTRPAAKVVKPAVSPYGQFQAP